MGTPPKLVFDEIHYVKAARTILADKPDPNWVHPPLAKLFIAGSIYLFGDNPRAWRFPAALAAVLAASFFFLISLELFRSGKIALLASFLYLFDGMTYVQARLAMLDIFAVGFLLPAVYFFLKQKYPLSSVFVSLAIASKWSAVFVLPLFVFSSLCRGNLRKTVSLQIQIILPALFCYFLMLRLFSFPGHPAAKPGFFRREYAVDRKMAEREWATLKYFVLRPSFKHPYLAPWWKLVLLIRPIWYSFEEAGGKVLGILLLPNPFLWWPALLACACLFFRYPDPVARFISFGALSFTLPWAISLKGGFMYYLLPASPFLVLALVYWIRENRAARIGAVCAALAGFMLFYPVYSYTPISKEWFNKLLWMKSWI